MNWRFFDPRVSFAEALPDWLPAQYQFAKVGLAGMAPHDDWPSQWQTVCDALPASTSPVAVVYADWRTCNSPPPEAVLQAATEIGCDALLIDTYDKSGGNLFAHFSPTTLAGFADRVRQADLKFVLQTLN